MQKTVKHKALRKRHISTNDMKRTKVHSFFSAELELFGHPRSDPWSKGEKETCIQVKKNP